MATSLPLPAAVPLPEGFYPQLGWILAQVTGPWAPLLIADAAERAAAQAQWRECAGFFADFPKALQDLSEADWLCAGLSMDGYEEDAAECAAHWQRCAASGDAAALRQGLASALPILRELASLPRGRGILALAQRFAAPAAPR